MTSQDNKIQKVRSARVKIYKMKDLFRLTETGSVSTRFRFEKLG